MKMFEHFPPNDKCFVCGTNNDAETVLVVLDGTARDGISEALPVHLECAIAKQYNRDVGVLYVRCGEMKE